MLNHTRNRPLAHLIMGNPIQFKGLMFVRIPIVYELGPREEKIMARISLNCGIWRNGTQVPSSNALETGFLKKFTGSSHFGNLAGIQQATWKLPCQPSDSKSELSDHQQLTSLIAHDGNHPISRSENKKRSLGLQ